jgi:hypothetical protein
MAILEPKHPAALDMKKAYADLVRETLTIIHELDQANVRPIAIALFLLIYPTTAETAYFGGISISIWIWSEHTWPTTILLSR